MKSFRICIVVFLSFVAGLLFAQSDPRPDALARYQSGREQEAAGRLADADTSYSEAIRICQTEINQRIATSDTYTVMCWALQRQKKYGEVISWGDNGLRLYPDDYRINEIMGEAYFYLDDYDNSIKALQRYVNALPRGSRASTAFFFLGEIYRIQGKFLKADMAYTTAVRQEAGIALWWYRLGLAREGARDYTAAVEAFQRALSINPSYLEASNALARSRARINSQSLEGNVN
jgi:tetratricopeptide (TPR) repeat protein